MHVWLRPKIEGTSLAFFPLGKVFCFLAHLEQERQCLQKLLQLNAIQPFQHICFLYCEQVGGDSEKLVKVLFELARHLHQQYFLMRLMLLLASVVRLVVSMKRVAI